MHLLCVSCCSFFCVILFIHILNLPCSRVDQIDHHHQPIDDKIQIIQHIIQIRQLFMKSRERNAYTVKWTRINTNFRVTSKILIFIKAYTRTNSAYTSKKKHQKHEMNEWIELINHSTFTHTAFYWILNRICFWKFNYYLLDSNCLDSVNNMKPSQQRNFENFDMMKFHATLVCQHRWIGRTANESHACPVLNE